MTGVSLSLVTHSCLLVNSTLSVRVQDAKDSTEAIPNITPYPEIPISHHHLNPRPLRHVPHPPQHPLKPLIPPPLPLIIQQPKPLVIIHPPLPHITTASQHPHPPIRIIPLQPLPQTPQTPRIPLPQPPILLPPPVIPTPNSLTHNGPVHALPSSNTNPLHAQYCAFATSHPPPTSSSGKFTVKLYACISHTLFPPHAPVSNPRLPRILKCVKSVPPLAPPHHHQPLGMRRVHHVPRRRHPLVPVASRVE